MFRIARAGRTPRLVSGAGTLAIILTLAGCGNDRGSSTGSYGFPQAPQDDNATITVWVDADRSTAVSAFKKANPDVALKVVTYDGSANGSNSFRTKMQLFDRANNGWPDVVFSTQNNDAAWASQKSNGKQAFAAVLSSGLVPKSKLDNFTEGSLNPCTVDGKVYCLRNDLAQVVLWYNKSLLNQFGTPSLPPGKSSRRSARRWPSSTPATSWAPSETPGPRRSTSGAASARRTTSPAPSR